MFDASKGIFLGFLLGNRIVKAYPQFQILLSSGRKFIRTVAGVFRRRKTRRIWKTELRIRGAKEAHTADTLFDSACERLRSLRVEIAGAIESAGYEPTIQAWHFRPGKNSVLRMQEAAPPMRSGVAH